MWVYTSILLIGLLVNIPVQTLENLFISVPTAPLLEEEENTGSINIPLKKRSPKNID